MHLSSISANSTMFLYSYAVTPEYKSNTKEQALFCRDSSAFEQCLWLWGSDSRHSSIKPPQWQHLWILSVGLTLLHCMAVHRTSELHILVSLSLQHHTVFPWSILHTVHQWPFLSPIIWPAFHADGPCYSQLICPSGLFQFSNPKPCFSNWISTKNSFLQSYYWRLLTLPAPIFFSISHQCF